MMSEPKANSLILPKLNFTLYHETLTPEDIYNQNSFSFNTNRKQSGHQNQFFFAPNMYLSGLDLDDVDWSWSSRSVSPLPEGYEIVPLKDRKRSKSLLPKSS